MLSSTPLVGLCSGADDGVDDRSVDGVSTPGLVEGPDDGPGEDKSSLTLTGINLMGEQEQ